MLISVGVACRSSSSGGGGGGADEVGAVLSPTTVKSEHCSYKLACSFLACSFPSLQCRDGNYAR